MPTPTDRLRELPPSHYLQYEDAELYKNYLMRWPWEWKVTLTFEPGITFFPAQAIFRRWRLRLADQEGIQVAGYRATRYRNGLSHMEALMLGRNRHGKTLLSCSPAEWKTRYPYHAEIKGVDDREGACDYLSKHLIGFLSDHSQIDPFNVCLLSRTMEARNDGLDNLDGLRAGHDGPTIGGADDVLTCIE